MAIYDINAISINQIFDVDGTTLSSAYDVDGVSVFSAETYDIDNVASYFRTSTLDVASQINGLSGDWQSFIFVTDPHGNANKQHSQAIGLYLLNNTSAFMLVLGGDYSASSWSKTEYENYVTPLLNSGLVSNIYALFGNHETYGGGTTEAKQCIYNDFLASKSNAQGQLADNYYYIDSLSKKTRFMFLNTSDNGAYVMSNAQLSWIASNVILPSADWSLVVLGHVNLLQMAGVTTDNETNGANVVSAIGNCNGTIVGYICGHQHCDITEKLGNIQHTTLLCDKFENTNYYNGISVTDRVVDTISEQAVSVVSINTTTKNVVVRRIGAGRASTFSYSYS